MTKKNPAYWLSKIPHEAIMLVSCFTILTGLFFSRALMSTGMIWLAGNALLHARLGNNFRNFLRAPSLLLITGYFLLMASSAAWSTNTAYLTERLQILLPFLVLPFAFHSMKNMPHQHADLLFLFFILLMTGGMGWSLWHYGQAKELYDTGYGFSRMIPTPFKNDHIRFSLAAVFSIALAVDHIPRAKQRVRQILLGLFILFTIIYLHILAAKSGLLIFYAYALILLIRLLLIKKTRCIAGMLLLLLIALPLIMFRVSTTFKNKIGYFRYSVEMILNTSKDANVSDEGRLISYSYAMNVISQHPLTGVGLGDVMDEMKRAYARDFPGQDVTVLLPHNQFLMAGMAAGIPGILYLFMMMLGLVRRCFQKDFLSFAFILMMLFAMMVEPLFETQYGTCMFIFFLLLLLQRGESKT